MLLFYNTIFKPELDFYKGLFHTAETKLACIHTSAHSHAYGDN